MACFEYTEHDEKMATADVCPICIACSAAMSLGVQRWAVGVNGMYAKASINSVVGAKGPVSR